MAIPGHDLVITRKSDDRSSPDFRLMRADCACGRRGCVYFRTTDEVERSYSHHVASIAAIAMTALNEIENAIEHAEDASDFVTWVAGVIPAARCAARR